MIIHIKINNELKLILYFYKFIYIPRKENTTIYHGKPWQIFVNCGGLWSKYIYHATVFAELKVTITTYYSRVW